MSDVRIVSPRETVIEVDAHAVPGRPGVVTPELRVLHDGAVDAAGVAASSAVEASGSAGAAASSASSAATSASEAVSSASSAATAQTGAEAARGAAEAAADTAETAATVAVTAKTLAEGFAGDAETALTSTLAAAVYELRGTGQPGSTTETNNAPVGTYYTDTAGTAGAWRWLKITAGSGVSRWSVVHGDTGWRNVLSLLAPEYWEGKPDDPFLRIKRGGDRVTIAGRIRAVAQIFSYSKIIDFPAGFRPYNRFVNLGVGTSASTLVPLGNQYWGTFLTTPIVLSPGAFLLFEISFSTKDTFPTTLPGTPA